ncbi:unnamed protein product [Cyclocybe aegerita]|uniref:Uncharacterized protein n=1 Tax=Cyclocybe aegerita TaxID=1973307 RepID=A0A8S0WLZ7_CYCAE|nr:unnamed protein product [Cyclocybe aegerita]
MNERNGTETNGLNVGPGDNTEHTHVSSTVPEVEAYTQVQPERLLKITDFLLKPLGSSEETQSISVNVVPPVLVKIEHGDSLRVQSMPVALKSRPTTPPAVELPFNTVRCAICIYSELDVFMGHVELGEEDVVVFQKEQLDPDYKCRFDLGATMVNGCAPCMISFTMAAGIKERNNQDQPKVQVMPVINSTYSYYSLKVTTQKCGAPTY